MNDEFEKLSRKNKLSADLFLFSVLATIFFTLLIVIFFMFVTDVSSIVVNATVETATGGFVKPPENPSNAERFLFVSRQLYVVWIMCFATIAAQIAAFVSMISKNKRGRSFGIAAFIISALAFPPLILIQLYGFMFLIGKSGREFYENLKPQI